MAGFLAYICQLRTMGSCVTHMTEIIAKTPAELRWRSGSNSWFEPDMYSKLSLRNQNVIIVKFVVFEQGDYAIDT